MALGLAVIGASMAGRAHAAASRAAPSLYRSMVMDAPGLGVGRDDGFVVPARALPEQILRIDEAHSLPRCAPFEEGVHNEEVLAPIAGSATRDGGAVRVPPQREPVAMSEAGAR